MGCVGVSRETSSPESRGQAYTLVEDQQADALHLYEAMAERIQEHLESISACGYAFYSSGEGRQT